MTQTYDVVIIGGGIIGNSIAAHLANEKLKIAVVNTNTLGTPASIASAGLLTPFQMHEYENTALKDFYFKSFEYFTTFYENLKSSLSLQDIDLGYKQPGSLYLIYSISETSQKEKEIKELKDISPKITFLNKQEIPKLEPLINSAKNSLLVGAYHYPTEAFINNPKLHKAISAYCIEKKIVYLNSEAFEINCRNSNVEYLSLSNGEKISGNKYVLCNGAWSNKFLKLLLNTNENLIKAIKGEILQVEAVHELPLQKIIFSKGGYILPRLATNEFERNSILIGSTSDEVDIEENRNIFGNTTSGIANLTTMFQNIISNYKEYKVTNMWSGLRPKTKDSQPILGYLLDSPNLICALGHYRNGILMGPYTGKLISQVILNNKPEFNIDPFKIDRLLKSQTSNGKLTYAKH